MSMCIVENGVLMSFGDYSLSEAIAPVKTEYGTDDNMSNGELQRTTNGFHTFFEHDGMYYVVALGEALTRNRTGHELMFATSPVFSLNVNDYDDSRINTKNALRVFNKVLYVLIEMLKEHPREFVVFDPANPALGRVYDKIVKNKFVLQRMKEIGYEYAGKHKQTDQQFGKHKFIKI